MGRGGDAHEYTGDDAQGKNSLYIFVTLSDARCATRAQQTRAPVLVLGIIGVVRNLIDNRLQFGRAWLRPDYDQFSIRLWLMPIKNLLVSVAGPRRWRVKIQSFSATIRSDAESGRGSAGHEVRPDCGRK